LKGCSLRKRKNEFFLAFPIFKGSEEGNIFRVCVKKWTFYHQFLGRGMEILIERN